MGIISLSLLLIFSNLNTKYRERGAKKFNVGDVVSGKVIQIEASKALIKIEGCEPIYIIKEVASIQKIESIEEVLKLDRTYEFLIAMDYSAIYYQPYECYLSIIDLEYLRSTRRIKQLAEENVTIYSKVLQAYDYGVLVRVENKDFIISNIHLKTKISNQELIGTTIPLKIITVEHNIILSHRWAVLNNNSKVLSNIFKVDDEIKAIVIWMDIKKKRVAVSTKELEIEPGDMLKDPQLVYKSAEKMTIKYHNK
jgi:small subunit ribosomal protein S1